MKADAVARLMNISSDFLLWLSNRRGSRILQGRVSNPSERGTGGRAPKAPRGAGSIGMGLCPSPYNFCISYIKMVSFCAFPVIFIDTVTVTLDTLPGSAPV